MPRDKQRIILTVCFTFFMLNTISTIASPNQTEGLWVALSLEGYENVNGYSHPLLLNFQSNANYDLISGRESGPLLYQKNGGGNLTTFEFEAEETGVFVEQWAHSAPALLDFNNDDQMDVIIGDASGSLHLMVRTGLTLTLNETYTSQLNVSGYAKPTAADINGDDLVDIVVGDQDGRLNAFINQGTPTVPNWVENADVFKGIVVGDFASPNAIYPRGTEDLPDLVVGTAEDGLAYLRNRGISEAEEFPLWDQVVISNANNPFKSVQFRSKRLTPFLIDLDGQDEKFLDLVVGGEDGSIEIFENNGVDLSNINPAPPFPIEVLIIFGLIVIPITIGVTLFVRGLFFKGKPIYLLIVSTAGISPYSFSFTGEEFEVDTLLAGGAFVGIQSLLAEITKSPELKSLDAGKHKILISKKPFKNIGGELQVLLWATRDDQKLRKSIDELAKYVIKTSEKSFRDSYFDESFTSQVNISLAKVFSLPDDQIPDV
ncbi:MAG: FG-GAP repeat domain-containing protein [Candidatus Thorarchaeota archaeon]